MYPGRTYTLADSHGDSAAYYSCVSDLVDSFSKHYPDESALRHAVRRESSFSGILKVLPRRGGRTGRIIDKLRDALTPFLPGLDQHLRTMSLAERLDKTIRTSQDQYLLYMIEIELTNRINHEVFYKAPWRMALIAHCLRDFRTGCRSTRGDVEDVCTRCDPACFVNLGSAILQKYGIHPYISVSMDHRTLFRHLRDSHPGMGVLGIACIPELIAGLRLCEGYGIPAVGVPLDANRCSRWMGECKETTFSLRELERLVKHGVQSLENGV